MDLNGYQTLSVRLQERICFMRFDRPEAQNTINDQMIREVIMVINMCQREADVLVIEGNAEVFCFGADFRDLGAGLGDSTNVRDPGTLYDVWLQLATGSFISIAHVRGKVNAGGIGFVAACDIVIANETAIFSLSELLFGLIPACVMPFLIARVGVQRAKYLTLTTQSIAIEQAHSWGLVDVFAENSELALRKHLSRLRCLSKKSIIRCKRFIEELNDNLATCKEIAVRTNINVFSDPANIRDIARYVESGVLPWEQKD